MTSAKRPTWRIVTKVLTIAVSLAVPVVAVMVLGGSGLLPFSRPAAAADEFLLLDTPPQVSAPASKPAQTGEPIDVELKDWEQTLKGSNSM
jgi:hypothetical protein